MADRNFDERTDLIHEANVEEIMGKGRSNGGRWTFGDEWQTAEEVQKAVTEGRAWPRTLEQYRGMDSLDLGDIPVIRNAWRQRVWDDLSGDTADIGRALVSIAPWEQYKRTAAKRSVTVGICATISCDNMNEAFNANTITAVRAVDALMAAGYDVRVVMVNGGQRRFGSLDPKAGWVMIYYPIKEFGQPFDQELVLAHGQQGWVRHFVYGHMDYMLDPDCRNVNVMCFKFPADRIRQAGIDVLIAKQWEDHKAVGQQAYTRKVFEEVKALTDGEVANAPT